jgi:hypothetical protein
MQISAISSSPVPQNNKESRVIVGNPSFPPRNPPQTLLQSCSHPCLFKVKRPQRMELIVEYLTTTPKVSTNAIPRPTSFCFSGRSTLAVTSPCLPPSHDPQIQLPKPRLSFWMIAVVSTSTGRSPHHYRGETPKDLDKRAMDHPAPSKA